MNLTRRQAPIATLVVLAAIAAAASVARAGGPAADKAIADGREAFGEATFPWYDAQTDSLKPLKFRERTAWQPWNLGPVLNVVAWIALAILVAAIVAIVIYVLRHPGARAAEEATEKGETTLAPDQVEALTFLAERRRDDLLGQARYHYQQGNYSEAIIYLFSYKLVQLDKFAVIHLAKGKTNRQYVRETSRVTELTSPLERTMLAFESVFFGSRALDRAGFEACWNALPQFEQQLRAAT